MKVEILSLLKSRKFYFSYRYGFNGKENDNEVKGVEGSQQDYGMRIYDGRLGRFLSVDPLKNKFPELSTYQFAGNTPIAAIDLDGEEPKIVVTNQVTGYTVQHVYGMQNVEEILVKTYKAVVQYTDTKGVVTTLGVFNVTRDSWYNMGTDSKGQAMLYNRSSDQVGNDKISLLDGRKTNHYGKDDVVYTMTPINSPIPEKYNSFIYWNGKPYELLKSDVKRNDDKASNAQFHVGAWYEKNDGQPSLAGTYGCYGIVDPSQVFQIGEKYIPTTGTLSNSEMRDFGSAVKKAKKMQLKEHNKTAPVEVELTKRKYNKEKTVKTK